MVEHLRYHASDAKTNISAAAVNLSGASSHTLLITCTSSDGDPDRGNNVCIFAFDNSTASVQEKSRCALVAKLDCSCLGGGGANGVLNYGVRVGYNEDIAQLFVTTKTGEVYCFYREEDAVEEVVEDA